MSRRIKNMPGKLVLVLALGIGMTAIFCDRGLADEKKPEKKVIDFDAEVIEGISKQPLDTLNQFSEGSEKRKITHLYRKRRGFEDENKQLLRELSELQ